jgi:RimJ/RimL family protein N-acetyltransferase
MLDLTPVTLNGKHARLEPLSVAHAPGLAASAHHSEIWEHMRLPLFDDAVLREAIDAALAEHARGEGLPFTIVDATSGEQVGMTRYLDVQHEHRGLEIGWTWLTPRMWRTAINTECKYLLLSHAFEKLGCIRVQLKTSEKNLRSRRAIERIGARFEGIVRKHLVLPNGNVRSSALYSILDDEWPAVKAALEAKLA